jgi:hypothetical protein
LHARCVNIISGGWLTSYSSTNAELRLICCGIGRLALLLLLCCAALCPGLAPFTSSSRCKHVSLQQQQQQQQQRRT